VTAIRSEIRKVFTTKMWWALAIPVALVSLVVNALGGLFEDVVVDGRELTGTIPSLLPITLAVTINQLVVFAAVAGTVAAAGEFRHRTITTTFLTANGRGAVLVAKLLIGALLGVLYALVASACGSLVGLIAQEAKPAAGDLLVTIAVGALVSALWGVIGSGVGMAVGNQVGALLAVLIPLLVGEQILTVGLANADTESVQELSAYLPGNAGDIAVLNGPAHALSELVASPQASGEAATQIVQVLSGGVVNPPGTAIALAILVAWTAVVVGLAAFLNARRDIT
jgi:ABC-type transport system involved in multi-copper enzyme maturation permease subunit